MAETDPPRAAPPPPPPRGGAAHSESVKGTFPPLET